MIAIPNFNPKDGLYQIDKGRIHKYKAKGGTVRVYDLIEIIQCEECEYYNGHEQYCVIDHFARENGFCSDGKRRTDYTVFTVNPPKGIETPLRGDATAFHQITQTIGE